MGLFSKKKSIDKKEVTSDYYNPNMSKEVFLQRLKEDDEFSPGWQAIDDAFEELYGNQKPYHLATDLHARAISGGDQYLDGYSIYQSSKGYKHIVTYGMTILYGDENAYGGEWNGWGYEMTIKLKETENDDCVWAVNMMSNLARYTYRSNRFFEPYQFVKGDGASLRIGTDSKITALLLVPDTEAKPRQTVYGRTEFLQLVGITQKELEVLMEDHSKAKTLAELMLADENIDLVTDMARTKSYF